MAEGRGRQRVKPARYQDEDEKDQHLKKGSAEKATIHSAEDGTLSSDDKSIISNASSSRGRPGISKSKLPKDAVAKLETWFNSNIDKPYPSKEEKQLLVEKSGLKQKQVESWMEKQRRKKGVQKQCYYSEEARAKLEVWFNTNTDNPYPTKEDKSALSVETGLSTAQVSSYMEKQRAKRGLKRKHRSTEAAESTEMARVVTNNDNDNISGLMSAGSSDELFAQYQQPPHYQQQQMYLPVQPDMSAVSAVSLPPPQNLEVKQVLEI